MISTPTAPDSRSIPAPMPPPIPIEGPLSSRVLAQALVGCWREFPEPATLDAAQIEALSPVFLGSGVGALVWRRLRDGDLASHPAAEMLGRLKLKQALDARMQERQIEQTFEKLSEAGIRALLLKGWATARVYPEAGLRAVGDIDLLIDPHNARRTEALLGVRVDDERNPQWDIKTRVPALYGLTSDVLFARAEQVELGRTEISILGAEDQLRVLCLHFLKHGAWRPLWACDIAAALEARPANFNWELCLGSDARLAESIECALGVAHHLVGARLEGTPAANRAAGLPRWLVPAVLREWRRPQTSQHQPDPLLVEVLRARRGRRQAARRRWPNPIQTAVEREKSLYLAPLPAQIAALIEMGVDFTRRTGRSPHP